jgi:WD40 repeat protein
MPRPERHIDPHGGPPQQFAAGLRNLRKDAGTPSYRQMAASVGCSVTSLSDAAGGRQLPGLAVTLAYVRACGGDLDEWERQWRAVSAVLADRRGPAKPTGVPPYQGLAHFEAADAARYFGRERLVGELVAHLTDRRFLIVFGPSGSGKSSLLRAGLLPALPDRATVVITPGPHPRHQLTPVDGPDRLIVVDQFEEVFTVCRDPAERAEFVELLIALSGDEHRTSVVIGVRADFLSSCLLIPGLATLLPSSTVFVGPMTEDELQRTVTGPAALAGLSVERALLAQVLADAKGQPGALPLLSHALRETWRHRRSTTLTLSGYVAAGGISGAIARTAEQAYDSFDPAERGVARQILVRLTALGDGTEDTRRRVSRAELDFPDATRVLDELARARLIVIGDDAVDIAHEALIGAWPRLHAWLAEDREGLRVQRRLTEATHDWLSLDRDTSALYRGTRLAMARDWVDAGRHPEALTAVERDFLAASLAAAAGERAASQRRARQLGILTGALAAMLALVVAAAGVAGWQWHTAVAQTREATSQHEAAQALNVAPTDVAQAMQLSLSAYHTASTVEARSALLSLASRHAYTSRLPHAEEVKDLAFSADGRLLATAGQDGRILLWDARRHVVAGQLGGGTGDAVRAIAISGHLLASGTLNGAVVIWDLASTNRVATLRAAGGRISGLAFSPDGRTLAAIGAAAQVLLWSAPDWHPLPSLVADGGARSDVAFSPDGRRLAVVGNGTGTPATHSAVVWDLSSQRIVATLPLTEPVNTVAFSPNGTDLAIGSEDPDIELWDISRGTVTALRGHTGYVRSLAFTPDGARLVSGGNDEFAILWDVSAKALITRLTGHTSELYGVAVSPDGRTIATASRDSSVLMFDAGDAPMIGHTDNVTAIAVSPDGHQIASASRDNTVGLWDPATRNRLQTLTGHRARVGAVAFSPVAPLIASASDDMTVKLWSTNGSGPPRTLVGHHDLVLSISFDPTGKLLASGSADHTAQLWNVATGTQFGPAMAFPAEVHKVVFSADGQTLVVATKDGTIALVALHGGTTRTLRADGEPTDVALSPDQRILAVGASNGAITLWDLTTGGHTTLPRVHTGTVSALAFSPDGAMLASGSIDQTVILWTLTDRAVWAVLTGHSFDVLAAAWSPDGRELYTSGSDRTITAWIVQPGSARQSLCTDLATDFPTTHSPYCPAPANPDAHPTLTANASR